jgi:hypothetical protein
MPSPSRNARKRAASDEVYDTDRFHDPSFRNRGPDRVKLEEEPVDVSFVPEHGELDYPV